MCSVPGVFKGAKIEIEFIFVCSVPGVFKGAEGTPGPRGECMK